MKIIVCFAVLFLLLFSVSAGVADEKLNYIAPSQLPNTLPQMNTAGYWIGRHPSPDKEILSAQEIRALNLRIQDDLKLTKDIFALTANLKTESLISDFDQSIKDITDKGFYTADGLHNDEDLIDRARANMNFSGMVLGVEPRYGIVTHYANVRFFPTDEGAYESNGDIDFDLLQNSSLDVGTAVAIVHQSLDKKWFYVFTPLSDGWVEADRIAIGDQKIVREYAQAKDTVVVTSPKVDVFLNEAMTQYHDFVRMGTRLPYLQAMEGSFKVLVPILNREKKLQIADGYLNAGNARQGSLPFTARSIYNQAFAMLNQPYGWGGVRGEQDCSAFLDEVFATVGIILPRDSKNQALIGEASAEFTDKSSDKEKLETLQDALGAVSVLTLKGHIMLYLGTVGKRPYAIHAVWAYRERKGDKDVPRVINRVVVSDLFLGEGSRKGSLLKRLLKIIPVK